MLACRVTVFNFIIVYTAQCRTCVAKPRPATTKHLASSCSHVGDRIVHTAERCNQSGTKQRGDGRLLCHVAAWWRAVLWCQADRADRADRLGEGFEQGAEA